MTQPPSGDPAEGTGLIPLFPLGTVLVPGLLLPLHVFEPRYRELVATLLQLPEDRREFGVVAIREGHEVGADAVRALYEVGTTALVRQVTPYDDGRFDLVTTGTRRFRLLGVDDSLPYLQGRVRWLPELRSETAGAAGDAEVDVLAASVARGFAAYRSAVTGAGAEEGARMPELPDDPTVLSYLVGAAMVLDLSDRQRLLERPDTATRLREELALLRRETGVLRALPSLPAVELARTGVALN